MITDDRKTARLLINHLVRDAERTLKYLRATGASEDVIEPVVQAHTRLEVAIIKLDIEEKND